MTFKPQDKVKVDLSKLTFIPPKLKDFDFVEGKITSNLTNDYWIRISTEDGFEILSCKKDALTLIVEEKQVRKDILDQPKNTTGCHCGAWITDFPDFHAHWCVLFKDMT